MTRGCLKEMLFSGRPLLELKTARYGYSRKTVSFCGCGRFVFNKALAYQNNADVVGAINVIETWSRNLGSVEIKLSFGAGPARRVCEVNHDVMWSAARTRRSE